MRPIEWLRIVAVCVALGVVWLPSFSDLVGRTTALFMSAGVAALSFSAFLVLRAIHDRRQ